MRARPSPVVCGTCYPCDAALCPFGVPGLCRHMPIVTVARAKGHDYVTLIYDLTPGVNCRRILWAKEWRDDDTEADDRGLVAAWALDSHPAGNRCAHGHEPFGHG